MTPRKSRYKSVDLLRSFIPASALKLWVGYALWVALFRLLILTFVAYFSASSPTQMAIRIPPFEEVSEAFSSTIVTWMGIGALLFLLLLRGVQPTRPFHLKEVIPADSIARRLLPGLMGGLLLAVGIVAGLIVTGFYRYLGFYIQFDEAPLAIAGVALRTLSILLLVYIEEYLFRGRMESAWENSEEGQEATWAERMMHYAFMALFFIGIKSLQFDLSFLQLLSLFLISIAVSLRAAQERSFVEGAALVAGLFIAYQPLFSLPIFGSDFSGILLIKPLPMSDSMSRIFTGGAGGPLAAFAFQILLLVDIARSALKLKRTLPITNG